MLKKLALVAVIGLLAGILIYPFVGQVDLPSLVDGVVARFQPVIDLLQQNPYLAPMLGGALTLFGGLVVNYFKNRAIAIKDKQVAALEDESTVNLAVISELQQKKADLEKEMGDLQLKAGEGVTSLSSQLTEAQRAIESKNEKILRLQGDISTLQALIADLKMKERVVIK